MNDGIKFLSDISSSFKKMKFVSITAAAICILVSLGSVAFSFHYANAQKEQVYVLDEGSVLAAYRSDNSVQKDLEVINHCTRFHELFFNMAPNINTINQNVDRALELADESAYNYYSDLREQQYFSRLIQANATQQIVVDSVKVNVDSYPYAARTYASVYILRESNITKYEFRSLCGLHETNRTQTNPHGLMIERFQVEKFNKLETRKRN